MTPVLWLLVVVLIASLCMTVYQSLAFRATIEAEGSAFRAALAEQREFLATLASAFIHANDKPAANAAE